MRSPFVVSTDWLFAHLDDENVSIVDGSWYLPAMNRDAKAEYDVQHIPGAVFFDIDAIADESSGLPHALAKPKDFARAVGALGIAHTDTIVVYDGVGLFSAARVWWNFRIMGAAKVVILDGGLPAWIEDRLPIEAGTAPLYPKLFAPSPDRRSIASFDTVSEAVAAGDRTILDARPNGRFRGDVPEPREGVRAGHMPGATNLPIDCLQRNGRLLPVAEIREVLESNGVTPDEPVITSCGSGVTAAVLSLALETIGHPNHRLYDGSWIEWGSHPETPVAIGP